MAEIRELTREEFRTMQLLQLDMIKELDRVCREHHIHYVIIGGTLLGAIRHKGYIPWDDDADIGMLREDYEKFKEISNELNKTVCYFQDHGNDPEYLWQYGKLRRTGTSFVRAGQEHIKGKTGVFIDVFPFDDVPMSTLGQVFQDFYCFFLRKILYARVGRVQENGLRQWCYMLLSYISVEWVYGRIAPMIKRSNNSTKNRVRCLLFPSLGKLYVKNPIKTRYSMPKSWFLERAEYEFEGCMFYGPKDYDAVLKYQYDDYMTPPPEEQREPHAPVSSFNFDVSKLEEP